MLAKLAWIFVISIAVAAWSWAQRYGQLPTSLHVGPSFLSQTGSYFIGSVPFAAIPRSAGLVVGVAVLLFRAILM